MEVSLSACPAEVPPEHSLTPGCAGMEGAADLKALQARGITHILNLSNYQQNPEVYREDKFQYLIINIPVRPAPPAPGPPPSAPDPHRPRPNGSKDLTLLQDLPTENLRAHWDRTNAFIREGLRFGQVHARPPSPSARAPTSPPVRSAPPQPGTVGSAIGERMGGFPVGACSSSPPRPRAPGRRRACDGRCSSGSVARPTPCSNGSSLQVLTCFSDHGSSTL